MAKPNLFHYHKVGSDVGHVVTYKGQKFEYEGPIHYVNDDGHERVKLLWTSSCADCGRPYRFNSSRVLHYPTRRCEDHRRVGKPVRM